MQPNWITIAFEPAPFTLAHARTSPPDQDV